MEKVIFILLMILATGCQQPASVLKDPVKPAPPVDVKLAWSGKHKDAGIWTNELKQALLASGIVNSMPDDASSFCPSYVTLSQEQRLAFWMQLMSIMVKYESSFNPKSFYMEPAPLNYYSIGLYQLSYEDSKSYPGCKLDKASKNLEDGVTNIKCAVIILSKLVNRDNRIAGIKPGSWKGGARYWAVLRHDKKGQPRPSYNGIVAYTKALPQCK
jgi:hypothetical protein